MVSLCNFECLKHKQYFKILVIQTQMLRRVVIIEKIVDKIH